MSIEDIATGYVIDKKVDKATKKIDSVLKDPDNEDKMVKMVEKIDKSSAMNKFRDKWDAMPKPAQWAALHVAKGPGVLTTMVKLGLVDYKGHLKSDGTVDDKEIEKMGQTGKKISAGIIKYGAFVIPELKVVAPFIGPLMKLDKVKESTMTNIRQKLRGLKSEVGEDGDSDKEESKDEKTAKTDTEKNKDKDKDKKEAPTKTPKLAA